NPMKQPYLKPLARVHAPGRHARKAPSCIEPDRRARRPHPAGAHEPPQRLAGGLSGAELESDQVRAMEMKEDLITGPISRHERSPAPVTDTCFFVPYTASGT
ncbi:MAG TPA: hypothetical protein VFO36_12800, partial [Nitrospiraceae bacterium]|nr:hypothetical protein [Nitrospiraceae bacterium]